MKLNQRLLMIIVSFLYLPLLLIAIFAYSVERSAVLSRLDDHLDSIASIQQDRIGYWRQTDIDRLNVFTARVQMKTVLASYISTRNPSDQQVLDLILSDAAKASSSFTEISILDDAGKVVASTRPNLVDQDLSGQAFYQEGKAEDSITIFFKDSNGKLFHYLTGPLVLDGKTIGVLVITSGADELIALANNYTGLGRTGETYIVKRDGQDILFLTPTRFDKDASLNRRDPNNEGNISALALQNIQPAISAATDYRGQQVIAATRYLPELSWGLVVKMDKSEIYQPIADLNNLLILVIFLVTTAVVVIYFVLISLVNRPILRLAKEVEGYCDEESCPRLDSTLSSETDYLTEILRQFITRLRQSRSDLAIKVAEMEKMNRAMLNRELKMTQLKNEISELKKNR